MFNPEFAWTIAYQELLPSATGEYLKLTFYCGYSTQGERNGFVSFRLTPFGDDTEDEFSITLQELFRLKRLIDFVQRQHGDPDVRSYADGKFKIRVQMIDCGGSATHTITKRLRVLKFQFGQGNQVLNFSMDRYVTRMNVSIKRIFHVDRLMSLTPAALFDRSFAYVFMKELRSDWVECASDWMTNGSLESTVERGYDMYCVSMRRPMQKICSAFTIPLDTLRRFSKATLLTAVKSLLRLDIDTFEGDTVLCIASQA